MKFECELKTVIEVEFLEPEKTLEFFTESDWKDCFYTFGDLKEVAEHLTNFAARFGAKFGEIDGDYNSYIDMEGFPPFLGGVEYNIYTSKDSEMGKISIFIKEELENDYTSKID